MTEQRVLDVLGQTGARLEGHFRYSSGLHGAVYIQCGRVFQYPEHAETLCKALAARFSNIDAVIGPALGAVLMSYEVSRHLGCRNLFSEREDGRMTLRRGFTVKPGERLLVVEDVVTTGKSALEVITLCKGLGAEIIGVGSLVNRSGGSPFGDIPFEALIKLDIPAWTEEECPLCKEGIPIVKPGSRPAS